MSYLKTHTDKSKRSQTEKISKDQVKNRAGGYVYEISHWDQLQRFLILGTMGATYYASERKMTDENLEVVEKCLNEDGLKAIRMAEEISLAGRAPKNDQAILLLAMASVHKNIDTRKAAFASLNKVCRIGTHLYQFTGFRKDLEGGWGRSMRDAIARWFNDKDPNKLAYQVAKYKQREGWSARDLLRKSHPVAKSEAHNAIYKWVVQEGKVDEKGLPEFLEACNRIKTASAKEAVKLIQDYNLPREVIPTELLNDIKVWDALLEKMPMTAMIRNLGKMSSIGLIKPNAARVKHVVNMLRNKEAVAKSRLHPVNVLIASMTYGAGHGNRGNLSWQVNRNITAALQDTFYLSFGNVEPTGKRTLLSLDVSGSMSGPSMMGISAFTPRVASAALSMVTLRTEEVDCHTYGFSTRFIDLKISARDSLIDVLRKISGLPFGGTDCSLPMVWAQKNGIDVDTFVIYTDNETWAGRSHPSQALKAYRKASGIPAKMIVCAMTSTGYSIADPKDAGSLDIVGFDSATPQVISEFSRG